jgi:hypothetical protein
VVRRLHGLLEHLAQVRLAGAPEHERVT